MNWTDHIADGVKAVVIAILAFLGGLLTWFVRRVLTDSQRIDRLEAALVHRDQLRVEDRAAIKEKLEEVTEAQGELRDGLGEIKNILINWPRK